MAFGVPYQLAPRDPVRDREILRRIDEAVKAGDFPLATSMARKALSDGLVHPQLYNLRSYWLEQQGRGAEALADIERVLALAQDKFAALTAYGFMLEKLHRQRDALQAFKQAAELAPNSAQAQFNLGWGELTTGWLDKAAEAFERVLKLDPNHIDAIVNMAELAYRGGDWARAREMANRALAIGTDNSAALTVLARVALEESDFAGAETILDGISGMGQLRPLERASLNGAVGDLRHAQGRYAEAFAAYSAANAEKRAVYGAKFNAAGKEDTLSHLEWLIDYFRDVPAEKWAAKHNRSERSAGDGGPRQHVFLVGFPRSGTTLLENILASHPQIASLDEKEMMADAFETFMTNARGRDRLAEGRPEDIRKYRDLYWQRVRDYGVDVAGKIFVDKHPLISMRLMVVSKLFPDAKILFAIRDPRDVVLSCFRRSFNMNFSLFPFLSLDTAATFYDGIMQLSRIEREKFGLDWHDLRHETLVSDFEGEVRKVCDFIGLDWNDEMRNFADRAKSRHIATPSALQIMRGLNREGVGAWRNYREQLAPILPILAPWVKAHGYAPE